MYPYQPNSFRHKLSMPKMLFFQTYRLLGRFLGNLFIVSLENCKNFYTVQYNNRVYVNEKTFQGFLLCLSKISCLPLVNQSSYWSKKKRGKVHSLVMKRNFNC